MCLWSMKIIVIRKYIWILTLESQSYQSPWPDAPQIPMRSNLLPKSHLNFLGRLESGVPPTTTCSMLLPSMTLYLSLPHPPRDSLCVPASPSKGLTVHPCLTLQVL